MTTFSPRIEPRRFSPLLFLLILLLVTSFGARAQDTDIYPFLAVTSLNDSVDIRLIRLSADQFKTLKASRPQDKQTESLSIRDFATARGLIADRLKPALGYNYDSTELVPGLAIHYNDGTTGFTSETQGRVREVFVEYYPSADILILLNEADGSLVIDFNDSRGERIMGDPIYTVYSPDRNYVFTGYYPGGAYDYPRFYLQKWDEATSNYRLYGDFEEHQPKISLWQYLNYAIDWMWIDNSTLIWSTPFDRIVYYKFQIIPKSAPSLTRK